MMYGINKDRVLIESNETVITLILKPFIDF